MVTQASNLATYLTLIRYLSHELSCRQSPITTSMLLVLKCQDLSGCMLRLGSVLCFLLFLGPVCVSGHGAGLHKSYGGFA